MLQPRAASTVTTHFYEPTPASLLAAFFAGRSEQTLRAYRSDLDTFAEFVGATCVNGAAGLLLARGHGRANALAHSYRAHLLQRGLAPATINRRLAALRSLVRLARTLGMVAWALEVGNVRHEAYRDTKGPGQLGVARLFAYAEHRTDAKGARDYAILRLLYDLGLRRGEVVSLDLLDLDLFDGSVAVLGKGCRQKQRLTLPAETTAALRRWLRARGTRPGPLFVSFNRGRNRRRLGGGSVWRIVRELGEASGVGRVRPHGLRHTAITAALDATNDIRAVQRFSRHKDIRILNIYDDNRRDLGGEVAARIASELPRL